MKYESTILKRLIDTYGVVGNPRYISEIIKEFIVRGKESFPNLFTHQADWLAHIDEFGLTPEYTVSYTGQQIYAPNTKEKPVKSAILKGNTGYRDIDTGEFLETFEEGRNLELVSVKMPVLTTTGKNLFSLQEDEIVDYQYDITTNSFTCFPDGRKWSDVPYVKLIGNQKYTISYDVIKASSNSRIEFNITNGSIPMKRLTNIGVQSTTFNIGQDVELRMKFLDGDAVVRNIQVEVGSTATSYEPYKSNILSTSEDVVLRGIGDVQDMLDCLTGEVVGRVGEIVLDGSEDEVWVSSRQITINGVAYGQYYLTSLVIPSNNYIGATAVPTLLCDKGVTDAFNGLWMGGSIKTISLRELNGKYHLCMNFPLNEDIKLWLQQNHMTLYYQLEKESIKTVDLTIHDKEHQKVEQLTTFKGGTHFTTSSQDGSLLPTLTVDVVTDLEEILVVCSSEGNTM